MDDNEPQNVETDPRFPTGQWTGFFLQYWFPGRHATNLWMTFRGGHLTGAGRDRVGAYTAVGSYNTDTGRCEWTKRYDGRHSVAYRGVNDGSGIRGVWELRQLGGLFTDRGGFHLWPEGTDVAEEADRTEEAVQALMRDEFGGRGPRVVAGLLAVGLAVALAALVRWGWGH